ncbi:MULTISPECIES: AraC family transcriptional regulator [Chryseobacterium]|jgi:AraC-like DNA-binding protein/mannose-6-phosphate isomerase-like protein (cupin superfamily)|uniref:L-rhamnose operon regulatory protein rhaS n=1 Tax=Chryseobacterium taihuense TaxID=1141221 RepID=A0A4V6IDM7_9FLAO|nr:MULTISPECIES: AraC family transcriptional regulator [Chryseobacterium]AZA56519.1 AraC family transcriptional regulator [Chryseobacterium shandongense]QQV03027.1 helix-turn-helix domain-containing protein [Chryseobacterium sp. FDAARGOS 1104]VFB03684.1 L-rhamnose operon regulatory protein rhaS [Chryseobacterium taihuense]
MKSLQLFTDKEITVKELVTNNSGLHKHHFFELIYVLEGTGIHNINNNQFEFSKGDVFLLTPEDMHTFEVNTPTKFCVVDFTKGFFSKNQRVSETKASVSDLYKQLEFIFHNHHNVKGNIISTSDKSIFKSLINQLIKEKDKTQFFDEIIIQDIIFLLLHFIARNIQQNISLFSKRDNPKSRVHEITAYIQQHIYDSDLLKISNIAAQFGKSPDHLNRYFKTETESTIKDYIIRYKLNLVKTRLKFSNLTVSEIASELNFTDESHLNKTFKNAFGKTAKQYKNEPNN